MRTLPALAAFAALVVASLPGCRSAAPAPTALRAAATPRDRRPAITLEHGSADERATQAQLERLFDAYDLSPWSFTDRLAIDEEATPHSHPLLTLHTRHLKDDLLLLATYVHEQSHWYFDGKQAETRAAMTDLEAKYPGLPVGYPDGGNDKDGTYLHLLVIPFEYAALRSLVGELEARQVMEFWATDHYRALYRLVLNEGRTIRQMNEAHGLKAPR